MMALRPSLSSVSRGLVIIAMAGFGLVAALTGGPATGPVAAVFPPWWDATRVMSAAADGGRVLRFGLLDFVVLVEPDEPRGRERLSRAGAWLLLAARNVPGCGRATGV